MRDPAPPSPTIAQLQGHSLARLVHHEIEQMILDGRLQPGAKLTESTLAEQLGVSRGPVRECFRLLEEAGLVRTEKNRGVFVRDLPIDEALEIFEVRAVMDLYVGRKVAQTAGSADVRELRQCVDAMDQAAREVDPQAYHRLNLQFHDRLLLLAGNAKLTATYRKLVKELSLLRRQNLSAASMLAFAREHRQIVKAIASGDADAAGQAMYTHVMNSRELTRSKFAAASPAVSASTEARPQGRRGA
ncbi:phosphonate utilization associated transcriptional regulator [Xenophilus arseniciresistens]|uniref:Phosphonate utilization associated transcriptional regulator n=1 Tax=Xenophilus arseniciresistens TaxID=1283306 RepID=A0AAE3N6F4_9BURK|nr:phosphonate utilization associated transcriptional regulator [Xenophilus arseniciresistens]MDA7416116.1 phosphonate utilization associated transcriptional regulator [Xenophilus arseniciresistens]